MDGQERVLQALDAAQAALMRLQSPPPDGEPDRAGVARKAHDALASAPWPHLTRAREADQHGWLSQLRHALQSLEDDPYGPDAERAIDEGLWAAEELERDLRRLVGARQA